MPKRNSPTSKPRKASFRFFALGFAAFSIMCAVGAHLFVGPKAEALAEESPYVPGEEVDIPREELAVTASSSALTEESQSVTVTFTSKKTEAYPNSSQLKNVYVTPIDPAFDVKTAVEEAKAAREEQGEEFVMPEYECTVFNVTYNPNGGSTKKTIVIPHLLTYSSLIVFRVTSIGSNVVFNDEGLVDYGEIEQIVIPDTITSIDAKAFMNVPENVRIRCEAPETYVNDAGETVRTYPEEWTDATPVYSSPLSEQEKTLLKRNAGGSKEFGEGADFFLGMDSEEFDLPLYVEYQLETLEPDGSYTPVSGVYYEELQVQSTNNDYDAVGSRMGVSSITSYVNIDLPLRHRIIVESLYFHNIYRAIPEEDETGARTGRFVPDFEVGACKAKPLITFDLVPHFSDFFSLAESSIASMGNYLQFEVRLDRNKGKSGYGIYPELQPTMWNANQSAVRNGTLQVRYQLASLDQASYRFILKDGSWLEYRIKTPINYIHIGEKGQPVAFLLDTSVFRDLAYENVRIIELLNFAVKADLYKPATNSIVTKSAYTVRFGSITLFHDAEEAKHFNMPLIIALTYVLYVVAFAAIAVGYYFYAKRRFRNDEFRRMNLKRYSIACVKNFVGLAFVVSALLFIVSRWSLMRTTLVTYNPLDAFVAAFTVVAAIYIGFSIKNLVVSIKNARKRREALRLKLDQDVADDGTK